MTVEEIFNKIITHMEEGLIYHSEFIKAYSFLGLWGYVKCQEYHYYEEMRNYKQFEHYYMAHYFKLLNSELKEKKEIFPSSWYKYSAQAVDIGTKRSSIKDLIVKWIEWEKETKKLYEEMYLELTNLREVAAAIKLQKYIQDVDKELSWAQKEHLNLDAIGYNLDVIIDWQTSIKKKYQEKIKSLFK